MFPITRLFDSEQAARDTIDRLVEGEEPRERSLVIRPGDANAPAQVEAAVASGMIMEGHRKSVLAALARGRTVLSSRPSELNTGRFVEQTLDANAVDRGSIVDYLPPNPAPFSEFFGLPVLLESKSEVGLFKFDKDSSFGLKLLAKKQGPLFGTKLAKHKSARGSAVERMSGKAAPLSSAIGLKLLAKRKSASGSAVSRMSRTAAPFSRFIGLRVLSKRN
ncbi:MAG: hypothetical protein AAF229_06050 [Pseudomonadota bacterium]